jgi:hypothetical protein
MDLHVRIVGRNDEFRTYMSEIDEIQSKIEAIASRRWNAPTD